MIWHIILTVAYSFCFLWYIPIYISQIPKPVSGFILLHSGYYALVQVQHKQILPKASVTLSLNVLVCFVDKNNHLDNSPSRMFDHMN